MKKTAIFFICLLFSILVNAQNDHLKFMGIPLNGTISQFQVKLQNKGLIYDVESSKRFAPDKKFNGFFAGEKCNVYVYCNIKSKVVYRAKAVAEREELKDINNLLNKFKEMLENKYINAEVKEDKKELWTDYNLYVFNDSNEFIGSIQLYVDKLLYGGYSLHIDYTDSENYKANESEKMEDL